MTRSRRSQKSSIRRSFPPLLVHRRPALYSDIADRALPHVMGRPLPLVRRRQPITRPDALRTQCVYVRHAARDNAWAPDWMPRVRIREKQKVGEYLYVDSVRALLAL